MKPTIGETLLAGEEYSPLVIASHCERRDILRRCQSKLTGKQSMLLILRYHEGRTFLEIAGVFKVTEVAVFQMHQRVLRILRIELAGVGILALDQIL